MALLGKLRKASYNGISFEVTTGSLTFGRRTVLHEYPFRDNPYVEDLGKVARSFSITGFVLGSDYVERSKKLMKACETAIKAEQPGKLVHPWLGSVDVAITDTPTITWDLNKRVATFTCNFIELIKQQNPMTSISWGDKLRSSLDSFISDVTSSFDETFADLALTVDNLESLVDNNLTSIVGCLSDSSLSKMFDLANDIASFKDEALDLLSSSPLSLAKSFVSAVGLGGFISSVRNWSRVSKSAMTTMSNSSFTYRTDKAIASTSTIQSDLNKAQVAIESLGRQIMLSNAVGAASVIGTAVDNTSEEDSEALPFSAREDSDVRQIRNDLLNLIEQEMLYTQDNDSDLYDSLEQLYINTYKALTNSVLGSDVVDYELTEPTPALVLAYDLYGDATRADEIVTRNGIVNSAFVPTKTLKVSAQ